MKTTMLISSSPSLHLLLPPPPPTPKIPLSPPKTLRRTALLSSTSLLPLFFFPPPSTSSPPPPPPPPPRPVADFSEIKGSGGVKALDLRSGDGEIPVDGDQVAIHYYGRLAAKQGWRFDSTYDHKDEMGGPLPFVFVLGSGKVISGIETTVKSMRVSGIRRIIVPPSQGYQSTSQEPYTS
ncbi:peptidyl-prolyl cis-trans isomerase FKBP17-1, chloroplastic isoform X1 [Iris pallida]|uniref:peptidylprolyl isomerase n=1 Tax=Iris pallida TaxID=29817 RepID=A0AAX6EDJ6_IRIPA|nr:peptidyl-prolyl cis-trans isomerase FKBP17-1, chloroplastic isoform X1 [Iris pallida]